MKTLLFFLSASVLTLAFSGCSGTKQIRLEEDGGRQQTEVKFH
jgi:hypothetical protein